MKAILYDYQKAAVGFIKNVERCGLFLDMGLGKAIANNSKILTVNKGLITVGQVIIGDFLYDRKGQPTKVLSVFPHTNIKAYKVTLKDGRTFTCCDEHIIPYYDKSNQIKSKKLKDIINNYKNTTGRTTYKYNIPQNKAVQFEKNNNLIQPYLFGANIGKNIQNNTYPNTEMIPDSYLYDSIRNRKQLIKGLLDTVGDISTTHENELQYYKFSTTNRHLADKVRLICQSLGYGVKIKQNLYKVEHNSITVRIYSPEIIVSSTEHLNKIKNHKYDNIQHKMTPIIDIQQVDSQDMTCFTVDNPERLFLINDYIVTHNTLITLTALVDLAKENRLFGHVLIIAPKRIAINTWADEITKWDHVRGARFQVLAGLSRKKRLGILESVKTAPPTIYIINRELIPELVDQFPGDEWVFPNVIIDEAQSFKNHASLRFKKLKSVAEYTHRFIELTGTPAPNGILDIWALIYLLDGGARLGKNITAFRNTHFDPGRKTPEGYPYEWHIKPGHRDYIQNSIKDIAISMKLKDYIEMPDITHNVIELEMTKKERQIYNQLKKDKILPLLNGGAIHSANAAVLSGALLQLSNGAIYVDEHRKDIVELHKHKLQALEEIVESASGNPILCFYWYTHDRLRLAKHLPGGEIFTGEPEQLKRWNNKEIPLLFAHPASAGHGLNFQYGGHILVFFCVPRSLELYEQSIARLYRNGQNEAVIVHYLKMKGTIEDQILASLLEKQLDQQILIESVRANLEDLLYE